MSPSTLRGRFVWHELLTSDTAAGTRFYGKFTGWKHQPYPEMPGYTLLLAARGPIGGVMLLPEEAKAMGAPPNWLSYIGTSDVDATARQAASLGGKVLRQPESISVGRFAVLSDPQGAVFAVYSPNLMDDADPKAQLGEFSWHELVTTDPAAAWSFYSTLFGWEKTRSMDMGDTGVYQMYGMPGLELGGIYKTPPGYPALPNWLPYILVPDAKKAASVSTQTGGSIVNGPMEVPGGGWIAMGMDPQGAAFAVHSEAKAAAAGRQGGKAAGKAARRQGGKAAGKKKAAAKPKKAVATKKAAKKAAPKKKPAAKKKAAPKRKAAPKKKARRR